MSTADSADSQLSIPIVTENDLSSFHAIHFGLQTSLPPAPTAYSSSVNHHAENSTDEYGIDEDDADGLGYYPDGAKRTLTDEQIAIFRHSEIQTLRRERRRKAEYEAQQGASDHDSSNVVQGTQDAAIITKAQSPQPSSQRDHDQSPRGNKRRKHSRNGTHLHGPSVKSRHVDPKDPRGRTTRRQARELDNANLAHSLELDY